MNVFGPAGYSNENASLDGNNPLRQSKDFLNRAVALEAPSYPGSIGQIGNDGMNKYIAPATRNQNTINLTPLSPKAEGLKLFNPITAAYP